MNKEQMKNAGYYDAFGACYRFLQRFGEVQDNQRFWDDAAREASNISQRYRGTQANALTTGVLLAIYDELERSYYAKYPNGGT